MTDKPATAAKVNHKQKVGRVVSDKMNKTVVVAVDYLKPHPIYRKTVRSTSKFYAHDENNSVKLGDTVRIEETRPLSKLKRWKVVEVIGSKLPPVVGDLPQEVIAPGRAADGAAGTEDAA